MVRARKRNRRLWDTYSFCGLRPEPTVRGIFGDPKARVIKLNRRSKKQRVGAAVAARWAGTTARSAGCAICHAGAPGYVWSWRSGGQRVRLRPKRREGEAHVFGVVRRTHRTLFVNVVTAYGLRRINLVRARA